MLILIFWLLQAGFQHINGFCLNQKWSNFEVKNVTLEFQNAMISKRHNKHKHVNQSKEEDDKIFVQFKIDSIPEKRPFLLSRDLVYAKPSGSSVDPFQVSFLKLFLIGFMHPLNILRYCTVLLH